MKHLSISLEILGLVREIAYMYDKLSFLEKVSKPKTRSSSLKTSKNGSPSTITQDFNVSSLSDLNTEGMQKKQGFSESRDKAMKEDHGMACDSDLNIS